MFADKVFVSLGLLAGVVFAAESCPPDATVSGGLVSVQWLDEHLCDDNVVVLDVRSEEDYKNSHIVGSVNVPFGLESAWSIKGEGDLMLEMPPAEDLFETLATAGISNPKPETKVILVTASTLGFLEAGPRVAATLRVAGISEGRVAILDGGYSSWSSQENAVSTLVRTPEPGSYEAEPDTSFVVDMDYVVESYERDDVILVDARAADMYSGESADPKADPGSMGHLPGAFSLPFSLIWSEDGTYRTEEELMGFVEKELGDLAGEMKSDGEVIVYCSTGGKAAGWYFVLSRILGFENVKIYDGSVQEWSRYYEMEV